MQVKSTQLTPHKQGCRACLSGNRNTRQRINNTKATSFTQRCRKQLHRFKCCTQYRALQLYNITQRMLSERYVETSGFLSVASEFLNQCEQACIALSSQAAGIRYLSGACTGAPFGTPFPPSVPRDA